jgi:protein TonB
MIKPIPRKYLNEHTAAWAAAVVVHLIIVAGFISSATAADMPQQVIQVTMVAPSAVPQEQVKKESKEEVPLLAATPGADSVKVEKKTKKAPVAEKKPKPAVAPTVQTSGMQSPDATEKHSARTPPVYNAVYLHNPAPIYPPRARRDGTQGKVLLEVAVTADGQARAVEIKRSSGSSLLDDAAKEAVGRWRFVPAKLGEAAVDATVIVPVEFKLN